MTLYGFNRFYVAIDVCTNTYMHKIDETRGHEFEGDCEGACGRVWREEREEMLLKYNLKINKKIENVYKPELLKIK